VSHRPAAPLRLPSVRERHRGRRLNAILVVPKQQLYRATTAGPSAWVASVNQTRDVQVPAVNASSGNPAFVAVPAARVGAAVSSGGRFVAQVTGSPVRVTAR
jgi:hypothetical protein